MLVALAAPAAWADLGVLDHRMYESGDGTLRIVGELKNDLNVPVQHVRVVASMYSGDGALLGSAEKGALMRTIVPGMKSPFEVVVKDDVAREVHRYDLDVRFEIGEPKSQVIDIESSEMSRDSMKNLIISGTVVNRGHTTANGISVAATLYDRDGHVVAVSRAFAEPDYLGADDKTRFVILVPERSQTDLVTGYSLAAESEEYASIPEFPAALVVLLAGSAGAYLAAAHMRRSAAHAAR